MSTKVLKKGNTNGIKTSLSKKQELHEMMILKHKQQKQEKNNAEVTIQKQVQRRKLFVGGVPTHILTDDLEEYFGQFGTVVDCVVMLDREGRHRGFGFVTFSNQKEKATALALYEEHYLEGKWIEVKCCIPKDEIEKEQRVTQVNLENELKSDYASLLTPGSPNGLKKDSLTAKKKNEKKHGLTTDAEKKKKKAKDGNDDGVIKTKIRPAINSNIISTTNYPFNGGLQYNAAGLYSQLYNTTYTTYPLNNISPPTIGAPIDGPPLRSHRDKSDKEDENDSPKNSKRKSNGDQTQVSVYDQLMNDSFNVDNEMRDMYPLMQGNAYFYNMMQNYMDSDLISCLSPNGTVSTMSSGPDTLNAMAQGNPMWSQEAPTPMNSPMHRNLGSFPEMSISDITKTVNSMCTPRLKEGEDNTTESDADGMSEPSLESGTNSQSLQNQIQSPNWADLGNPFDDSPLGSPRCSFELEVSDCRWEQSV